MVAAASQSHVLHWQRCTAAAAATAPGATGGHGVGSHVADAENSGAPPPLPPPVATSALNEGLVGGQPLPLFRAFLFLSSDGNPLLSLFSFSSSGLDRFLSPSFPVYLFSRGRRPAFGGRDGRGEHRRSRARSAKLVTFQSCNALWTHAPTSRAVNLRTTRLFIIEEYERL